MHGGKKLERLLTSGGVELRNWVILDPYNQVAVESVSPTLLASQSGTHCYYVIGIRKI